MQESFNRRVTFVGAVLIILAGLIVYRLFSIQFGINTAYFAETALTEYRYQVTVQPPRGEIYDRSGVLLATNRIEYEIGVSPALIYDREGTAQALAEITGLPYDELLTSVSVQEPYILLVRPAPATMGQALLERELDGVVVTPIQRRYYPHGSLAAHVLGFVGLDQIGYYGIEGFYNQILAGQAGVSDQSRIPFEASGGEAWRARSDLYLTIDSEVQYLAETALAQAISDTGAQGGTIIILDPRTGEILAMASAPTFDPNLFYESDPALYENPAINQQYEPGSTIKVLTMAIALEDGVVTPTSTYDDTGVVEVGGITVNNWDQRAHGVTTMTDLLALSLNVGATHLSLELGPTRFYDGLAAFGLGQPTGVDLQGEVAGSIKRPGSAEWHEADLATNSFGQGMAVTPLQLAMAVGAVAHDGLIMQPHMVIRRVDVDGTITDYGPAALGRAISPETADSLSLMLTEALEREASRALVPGYSIAGKTGTAEIPIPGGYDPRGTIASFVGFGPVDDPRFVVLIKLDRPTSSRWGSDTAAPAFGALVERLVVLLEIPPDSIRLAMGGQ